MRISKVQDFLEKHNIKYTTIKHSRAYTSSEIAESAHIPGKEIAKTVMAKIDDKMSMVVLPASQKVDFDLLKEASGGGEVALATEDEFQYLFTECEVGAMPPFGNLYGMEVFVDETLTKDKEIAFNAGSHTDLIRMAYNDFERLVNPKVVKVARH